MATYCPGCNKKLSFLDWKQLCPECGTNLMYEGFEERFFEDAKRAELGNAKVRVWWTIVLACFFGGKTQIIRLCFVLLPIAALLVPVCSLSIKLPLYDSNISVEITGAISAFGNKTFETLFAVESAVVTGETAAALKTVYLIFGAAAVCAVLILLFQLLCFISPKVLSIILSCIALIGAVISLCEILAVNRLLTACSGFNSLFAVSMGFGHFVLAAAFIAVSVPNIILCVRGIKINYREGDLYRVETANKLKHGLISLSDLPQPVFETEEEKAEREEAIYNTMNGKSSENINDEEASD